MPAPLVSIIIPTFNQRSFIVRAVESALAQTYPQIEVLVADDHSADDTQAVLQRFLADPRFHFFSSEVNRGRVANYKYALANYATGEWVVNLDGDDYYCDPDFISTAIKVIGDAQSPVVFLQAGQYIQIGDIQIIDNPKIDTTSLELEGKRYFLDFLKWNHFAHLATLFSREHALKLDFYRFDIASADVESFLRLALEGNVVLLKRPVGVWVHHGRNFSQTMSWRRYVQNIRFITGPFWWAWQKNISRKDLVVWFILQLQAYLRVMVGRKLIKPIIVRFFPGVHSQWMKKKEIR